MAGEWIKREHAPYRYDIVGSFLRPEKLKAAREAYAKGALSQEQLAAQEDACILDLVEKELSVGLKNVTDGEFRRSYWHLDFMWGFEGVDHVTMKNGYFFHGEETRADSARLSGKIRFVSHPFVSHFAFLQKAVGNRAQTRQTIPAPAQFLVELERAENAESLARIYPDRDALYSDLTDAYRGLILSLYGAGCRTLQLDDCTWGMLCDSNFRKYAAGSGVRPEEVQKLYLALNNAAIDGLPADLTVNTHVCRGNYHSTWAASGGYAPVARTLLGGENVNAYYLEFDDERSGDFAPLQEVTGDKLVALGLLTTKSPALEPKERVLARVEEASRYVPLERLCLSPQCGFASTEEGNVLSEEQQWAKLSLAREIAREIWPDA